MNEPKQKLPEVVRVLIITAFVAATVVGFGEYLFYTKPLQDENVKNKKEVQTLTEQVHILTQASGVLQTYENSEFGFSFQYPTGYKMVEVSKEVATDSISPEAFIALRKKSDTTDSAVLWLAVRDTQKAITPETSYANKVIKSETKIGNNDISATSLSLLPGRGNEFGSSLHVVHIIVPLKNNPSRSVVLTNIGDTDLAVFQIVLKSFTFL